jgi:hypothetical protein
VIAEINPILRGWVNYFRIGNSSRCFGMVKRWVEEDTAAPDAGPAARRDGLETVEYAVDHGTLGCSTIIVCGVRHCGKPFQPSAT